MAPWASPASLVGWSHLQPWKDFGEREHPDLPADAFCGVQQLDWLFTSANPPSHRWGFPPPLCFLPPRSTSCPGWIHSLRRDLLPRAISSDPRMLSQMEHLMPRWALLMGFAIYLLSWEALFFFPLLKKLKKHPIQATSFPDSINFSIPANPALPSSNPASHQRGIVGPRKTSLPGKQFQAIPSNSCSAKGLAGPCDRLRSAAARSARAGSLQASGGCLSKSRIAEE